MSPASRAKDHIFYRYRDDGVEKCLYELPCGQQMNVCIVEGKLFFSGGVDIYDRRYAVVRQGNRYTLVDRRQRSVQPFPSARDAIVSVCRICTDLNGERTCGRTERRGGDPGAIADRDA